MKGIPRIFLKCHRVLLHTTLLVGQNKSLVILENDSLMPYLAINSNCVRNIPILTVKLINIGYVPIVTKTYRSGKPSHRRRV